MARRELAEDDVARYWDGNADLWAEQVREGWDAYREYYNNPAFLKFLGDLGSKEVLDAGCGEGYNTRILARRGARMAGIDISERMIQLAREEEAREPLGIRYEVASFTNLSLFEDASFGAIVSTMALMDSPDFEKAAGEFLRVLRKGGEIFFSITHPCFMTKGYDWLEDEQGDVTALAVAHYFDRRPHVERWRFSKGPIPPDTPRFSVPRYDRTFSDYLNGLIRAGFVLREVEEARPTDEACRKHPWLRRWREHAALFVYFHAIKP